MTDTATVNGKHTRTPAGPAVTDEVLLTRIGDGNTLALDVLIDRYWSDLVSYSARIVGSWDTAEDVAQEAFVRVWSRRATWTKRGSARALLYRVTRNLSLDWLKSRERRARRLMSFRDRRRVATPSEEAECSRLQEAFAEALAALPERRREVFLLSRTERLSYREIADVMGIAPQTVANQLAAAIATLRNGLSEFIAESGDLEPLERSANGGA